MQRKARSYCPLLVLINFPFVLFELLEKDKEMRQAKSALLGKDTAFLVLFFSVLAYSVLTDTLPSSLPFEMWVARPVSECYQIFCVITVIPSMHSWSVFDYRILRGTKIIVIVDSCSLADYFCVFPHIWVYLEQIKNNVGFYMHETML